MKAPISSYVTLVEALERTASWEEFETAIQAATRRLEAEGIDALVNIQFYAEPDTTEVGAIIMFADGNRITEHIALITGWEEFHALLRVVKPLDIRVYGQFPEEGKAWLRRMNIVSHTFERQVAGFVR